MMSTSKMDDDTRRELAEFTREIHDTRQKRLRKLDREINILFAVLLTLLCANFALQVAALILSLTQ